MSAGRCLSSRSEIWTYHNERRRVPVDVCKRFSRIAKFDDVELLRQETRHVGPQVPRIVHQNHGAILEAEKLGTVDVFVARAAARRVSLLAHFGDACHGCRVAGRRAGIDHDGIAADIVPPRRSFINGGEIATLEVGDHGILFGRVVDLVNRQVRVASLQTNRKGGALAHFAFDCGEYGEMSVRDSPRDQCREYGSPSSWPPIILTSSSVSARPMPVPVAILDASTRWKRSKILLSSVSGMPMPVSETERTASALVDRRRTEMVPDVEYLKALPTRLKTIFSRRSGLRYTGRLSGGSSSQSITYSIFVRSIASRKRDAISRARGPTLTGRYLKFMRPPSIEEKSSNLFTIDSRRFACRLTIVSFSRCFLPSLSLSGPVRMSSRGPRMSVRGVRSSCDTEEKKLDFALSSCACEKKVNKGRGIFRARILAHLGELIGSSSVLLGRENGKETNGHMTSDQVVEGLEQVIVARHCVHSEDQDCTRDRLPCFDHDRNDDGLTRRIRPAAAAVDRVGERTQVFDEDRVPLEASLFERP